MTDERIAHLLRRLEWSEKSPGCFARCPICGAYASRGEHYVDCEFANILMEVDIKPAYSSPDATAGTLAEFFASLPAQTKIYSLEAEGGEINIAHGFQATKRPDGAIFVGIVEDKYQLTNYCNITRISRGK
jgi:hypothetical protein